MGSGGSELKALFRAAEIASFVFLVLFKDVCKVSQRFHHFVSDIKGMRRQYEFKIFLLGPGDGKIFIRSSASC